MRILTVRQPWAWAIFHGKDVENRVRNIAGDYRGPVAIHAGVREDTSARTHPEIVRLAQEVYWTTPANLMTGRFDMFGHIIGVVDLVDVHWSGMECSRGLKHCHEYDLCSPWADAYHHHLVLANPRPLAEPVPYRGALGLRKLDADVVARVEAALE